MVNRPAIQPPLRYTPVDLVTHVYEVIRDAIFTGAFEPGEQLKEQVLADEFGFSRTPVREALKRLAADGFALAVPRSGVFVRSITLAEQRQVLICRRSVESGTAPLAAERASDHELGALRELADELDALIESREWKKVHEFELAFHRKIMELARDDDLRRIASNTQLIYLVLGRKDSIRHRLETEEGKQEVRHADVAGAIATRNPVEAFRVMWDHLTVVLERIDQYMSAESKV